MAGFNLIDERWIPCITLDGKSAQLGVRDVLLRAHELREICDDSPLVTVAIHRLLLAILYRAFQGPSGMSGWRTLYAAGSFDGNDGLVAYLSKWRDRFWLFCDAQPFYQMADLETNKAVSVNRLATECASGNNATLFDHCNDDEEVAWPLSMASRQLVACQSFALGFGKSGNAKIGGHEETLPYSADAIALRGMTVWLQGASLFETLMINLFPVEDGSLPPWELDDPHLYRDRLDGKDRRAVASFGVVDRLTWQSRLVRLIADGATVSRMYFTQGRSADKSAGDPMKVYRALRKEGVSAMPLSSGKAAWRDSHSILTIPPPGGQERRPECFNVLARTRAAGVVKPNRRFVVHVVGLASAPKKAGKFLIWRHERMPVPAALLEDVSLIERLGGLLQNAEQGASQLWSRTNRIATLCLSPTAEDPDGRKPDPKDVEKMVQDLDPRPAYWSRLEKHFFDLLENLPGDWDAMTDELKPDAQQAATRAWREAVKREATRALEEIIRSLGTTARAIAAVARVRTTFTHDDLKPHPPSGAALKRKKKTAGKGGKRE